jgi:hypothetical protein
MLIEKIPVRVTENGKTMEVVVLSRQAHCIQVVLGEGVHSVTCDMMPTPNRMAFSAKALGSEIVYERSPEQVQSDLDRANPALRKSRPGR